MNKKGQNLINKDKKNKSIDTFIKELSTVPKRNDTNSGKILFGIDATASRQPLWDRACHIQEEMFDSAFSLGGIIMQIAYYHGFGKFNVFPWLKDPKKLKRYMGSVNCLGGLTQINRFLEHVIQESSSVKIDAVIL